jgi:hypothetical protein
MKVHSTACATVLITSHRLAGRWRMPRHAASRRTDGLRRAREAAGRNDAVDMGSA